MQFLGITEYRSIYEARSNQDSLCGCKENIFVYKIIQYLHFKHLSCAPLTTCCLLTVSEFVVGDYVVISVAKAPSDTPVILLAVSPIVVQIKLSLL